MKRLLTLDCKDYTDDMPVFEKHTVRAIIMRDGKLSMQLSGKGEYKIPGGGVECDESHIVALVREVREETGLIVIPESIVPIGEILELRQDVFKRGVKYICHSYYYSCDVLERTVGTEMTQSEIEHGFHPVWEYPEVICRENEKIQTQSWQKRDTEFVRMLLDGRVMLNVSQE